MFRLILTVPAILLVVLMLTASSGEHEPAVRQPFGFNHKLHMEEDLTCTGCHLRAEEGVFATMPPLRACLLCHEEAQGEDPDEAKVREYAELGDYVPWVQVNELVGHVYFSHEAHVSWGGMDCKECHGDIANSEEVLTQSQVEDLTMTACMDCHEERGASLDCNVCHK
jgi:hypothetical protein